MPPIVGSPHPWSRRKVLALAAAIAAGIGFAGRVQAAVPSRPTLLVVGDSLSAGYGLETGK
ncbi:MAG: arylesterase, partial [Thiomonas sp.]|nr:arylesterase [Thiomonas sp.]